MNFHRASFADRINPLMGFALDVDALHLEAEVSCNVGGHLRLFRGQLGSLADHRDVEIHHHEACRRKPARGLVQEEGRITTLPFRRRIGECLSDIRESHGSHDRVEDSVEDRIAVGVTHWPHRVVEVDASEHKGAPMSGRRRRFQPVEVVSVADAEGAGVDCRHLRAFCPKPRLPVRGKIPKGGRTVDRYHAWSVRLDAASSAESRPTKPTGTPTRTPRSTNAGLTRRPHDRNAMTRLAPIALVAATLVLAGCYGPRGAIYPYSGNGYTYVSTEMKPVTITLFDTRTDEPFFKMEIPVGKQLTLNFLEGKGDDPVLRPDRMVYAIMDAGTSTGRLTNQLTCPPLGCRRIVYDLRPAPEAREMPAEYDYRIDGVKGRPAWWTPQGGELPREKKYYE